MRPMPSSLARFSNELEERLFHFEDAWNAGVPENLRDYCPEAPNQDFILELLRIDIARRRAANLTIPLANYLTAFPEVAAQADVVNRVKEMAGQTGPRFHTMVATQGYQAKVTQPGDALSEPAVVVHAAYGGLRLHAQGGLGEVYIAEDALLHRPVAVKLLQERWLGSRRAVTSFLRESEVTSRLEHPGVVPVHGVGETSDGRPCYSMRFVEGETLRAALERFHEHPPADPGRRAVAFRELLTRFVAVCNTMAYAHTRGVIHRDLKPDNVMLGSFGETLVLDWGLAKDLRRPTEEGRAHGASPSPAAPATKDDSETRTGEVLGTPAFLSPEQAAGRLDQIGVATDVFGLGATLYAILVGKPPYQDTSVPGVLAKARAATFEPPRRRVRSTPAALEAICLKAMAREPADRYPDALALARDVENWLAGERVNAWREPWLVSLRRFLRRRQPLVAALSLAAVLVPAAIIVASWFIAQERAERMVADRTAAIKEHTAARVTEFLVKTFQSADPIRIESTGFHSGGGRAVEATLQRMLESGTRLLRDHLQDQPLQRAELLDAIGNAHRNLGECDRARDCLAEAHELRRQFLGPRARETLASLLGLARVAHEVGDYAQAQAKYRDVIAGREALQPPDSLAVAEAQFFMAWSMFDQPFNLDRPQFNEAITREAERLLKQVLEVRERFLPANHREIGHTLAILAMVKACQTRQEWAAGLYAMRAAQIFQMTEQDRAFGNVYTAYVRAERHRRARQFRQAGELYEVILAALREQLGPRHPMVVLHMANMLGLYRAEDNVTKGLPMAWELVDALRHQPALRSQPVFVDALRQIGDYLHAQGSARAASVYADALRYARERTGDNQDNIKTLEERLQKPSPGQKAAPDV
jgi:tetratricopeptide (TPR) repeat protein